MFDEKFRKCLVEAFKDYEDEDQPVLFTNPSFDKSIVGITATGNVVYDLEKMINEYMKDNKDCSYNDAYDFIDYNTLRSIPYIERNKPIIISMTKKSILDQYGEYEELD